MNDKSLCLISGGIDSPLAAAMMSKKTEIVPMHFVLYPYYCEETFSLCIRSLERLKSIADFNELVLFPWGKMMSKFFSELESIGKRSYSCLMCRYGMFKAASMIANDIGANAIVTGESVGQKASQTLDNLKSSSFNVDLPILRPLIGMNKQRIIDRSKELGLFMSKHSGCCTATPENPRTATCKDNVSNIFYELNLDQMIGELSEEAELISLDDKKLYTVFHEYLRKMLDKEMEKKKIE